MVPCDIVISEHQITFDPHDADEEYDPYPEVKLCYKELRSAASPMLSPPLRCSLYAMASVSMGGSRSPLEVKCFAAPQFILQGRKDARHVGEKLGRPSIL